MSDFFARQARNIAANAVAPVEAFGARFVGLAGLASVAIVCIIAAVIFLSVALDLWVAQMAGPVIGALATAGFYILVALICLAILLARSKSGKKKKAPPSPIDVAETAKAPNAASSSLSANLEETVAPFVAILQQSGLKREAVAVRLATEATKELGPLALVALALAVGFLSERSINNPKKQPPV
jgi:hypothetical protein